MPRQSSAGHEVFLVLCHWKVCDKLVNGTLGTEFLFIFSFNVAVVAVAVVQIKPNFVKGQPIIIEAAQRVLKQAAIISLKLNLTSGF